MVFLIKIINSEKRMYDAYISSLFLVWNFVGFIYASDNLLKLVSES